MVKNTIPPELRFCQKALPTFHFEATSVGTLARLGSAARRLRRSGGGKPWEARRAAGPGAAGPRATGQRRLRASGARPRDAQPQGQRVSNRAAVSASGTQGFSSAPTDTPRGLSESSAAETEGSGWECTQGQTGLRQMTAKWARRWPATSPSWAGLGIIPGHGRLPPSPHTHRAPGITKAGKRRDLDDKRIRRLRRCGHLYLQLAFATKTVAMYKSKV